MSYSLQRWLDKKYLHIRTKKGYDCWHVRKMDGWTSELDHWYSVNNGNYIYPESMLSYLKMYIFTITIIRSNIIPILSPSGFRQYSENLYWLIFRRVFSCLKKIAFFKCTFDKYLFCYQLVFIFLKIMINLLFLRLSMSNICNRDKTTSTWY